MSCNFSIIQNPTDGSTLSFRDTSENVNLALVKAVRFYFGSFLGDQAANQTELVEGDALDQWREYLKTSLDGSVYDLKTIVVGQRYIPFVTSLTVLSGDTFTETGRTSMYVAPADYLPTSAQVPFIFDPQDLLYPSSVTVFEDAIRYLQYEQYGDSVPNPLVNMVDGATYLVEGTGTCVYNGSTYRTGEQIIGQDTNGVSFTGSATLRLLMGVKFQYFATTWNAKKNLHNLFYRAVASCGCNCEYIEDLMKIEVKLKFINDSNIMDRTSATLCNDLLTDITWQLSVLDNQIPQV